MLARLNRLRIQTWPKALCVLLCAGPALAQSAPDSVPSTTPSYDAKIIPPAPEAPGGGNPFQGLGRPDDPAASRRSQFESSDSNASATDPSKTEPTDVKTEENDKEKEKEAKKKEEEKNDAASKVASPLIDTPIKKAVLDLQLHKYDDSLSTLNQILSTNPRNAEAHYLKAVVLVLTRHYTDAETEYRLVLKNAPSQKLTKRAKEGLTKLAR